jgi:hypothetical protein
MYGLKAFDLNNCASLAQFDLASAKFELKQLKEAIAKKSAKQSETAILELGQLCKDYILKLSEYEHLFTMATTAKIKQQSVTVTA